MRRVGGGQGHGGDHAVGEVVPHRPRQRQSRDVVFGVAEVPQHGRPAPLHEGAHVATRRQQRHLGVSSRGSHHRVQRHRHLEQGRCGEARARQATCSTLEVCRPCIALRAYLVQPGECHAQPTVVLDEAQGAGHAVKHDPDGGGLVLRERVGVGRPLAVVPHHALVRQSPAVLVLACNNKQASIGAGATPAQCRTLRPAGGAAQRVQRQGLVGRRRGLGPMQGGVRGL